jgi:beta-N-acetylglucosaminidase
MTDFLKNLKESLEAGEKSEAVLSTFEGILTKATEIQSDPNQLKSIESKAVDAQATRKSLTEEEKKEMEFLAMKQQQKIDEFEFNTMLSATLVNVDLAIEKLNNKIEKFKSSSAQLRDTTLSIGEKKLLMKEVLKDINRIESPVTPAQKFTLGNNDEIYAENV